MNLRLSIRVSFIRTPQRLSGPDSREARQYDCTVPPPPLRVNSSSFQGGDNGAPLTTPMVHRASTLIRAPPIDRANRRSLGTHLGYLSCRRLCCRLRLFLSLSL